MIDFGVAKATAGALTDTTLNTGFEQVVGTPLYMSPEQATFNQLDIDTRSDVYSLGVLLYELLTGSTPIERARLKQAAFDEILRIVREEDPPRPSNRLSTSATRASVAAVRGTEPDRLTRELRNELDWVVMKSLEKDRGRRYDSASDFAADVERYLSGEPVQAHPPSGLYRAKKFVFRHKAPVAAAVAVLLGGLGGLAGTVYGTVEAANQRTANSLRIQAESDRDSAFKARGEAEIANAAAAKALAGEADARKGETQLRERTETLEYALTIEMARREYRDGDIRRARSLLLRCPASLRGWEWHHVHLLCHADLTTFENHQLDGNRDVCLVKFGVDGRRVVSSDGSSIRVWDSVTGKELRAYENEERMVRALAFPAAGPRALVTREGKATILHLGTVPQGFPLQADPALAKDVVEVAAFNLSGSRVATAHLDKAVRIWDAETGKLLATVRTGDAEVRAVALSADGKRVMAADDKLARMWDVNGGKPLFEIKDTILGATFAPDGARLVALNVNGDVIVIQTADGQESLRMKTRPIFGVFEAGDTVAINADGTLIASGHPMPKVWDAKTGEELLALKGHEADAVSVSFGPGGRLVSGARDSTARVWDASAGRARFQHGGFGGALPDEEVLSWEIRSGQGVRCLDGHSGLVNMVRYNPDDRLLVSASADGTARIWDVAARRELHVLRGHVGDVRDARFSPDGSQVLTGGQDGTARLWSVRTGRVLTEFLGHARGVMWIGFSSDAAEVRTCDGAGEFRAWGAGTGKLLRSRKLPAGEFTPDHGISPDGTKLLLLGDPLRVLELETGRELLRLQHHAVPPTEGIYNSCFSEDGRLILTTGEDETLRVWDAATGARVHGLACDDFHIQPASRSADGTRLLTTGSGRLHLWDCKQGVEVFTFQ